MTRKVLYTSFHTVKSSLGGQMCGSGECRRHSVEKINSGRGKFEVDVGGATSLFDLPLIEKVEELENVAIGAGRVGDICLSKTGAIFKV
jgi:hypothetical protein